MKKHEYGNMEHDDFGEGLGLGYDDGDIRGSWAERPMHLIIPKLGSFVEIFTERDLEQEIGGIDEKAV